MLKLINLNVVENICKDNGFIFADWHAPGRYEGGSYNMGHVKVLVPGDFSSEDAAIGLIQVFEANRIKEFPEYPGYYFIARKLLVQKVDVNGDLSRTYFIRIFGNKIFGPAVLTIEAMD